MTGSYASSSHSDRPSTPTAGGRVFGVERLSERWGMELTSAGRNTVWAVLVNDAPLE